MAPQGAATILHADLDAFYASVEQLLDPSLRGQPIAVGAGAGVVLAASYEARAFGVRCRHAGLDGPPFVPGLALRRGTLPPSISAWAMRSSRCSGTSRPRSSASRSMRPSWTWPGLSVASAHPPTSPSPSGAGFGPRSAWPSPSGSRPTKHLAKIASQVAKPDGLVVVEAGAERDFLDPLPVGLIWGVGPVTHARLASAGIRTIGELAATGGTSLEHLLGRAAGAKLSALSSNRDPRPIEPSRSARSVGAQAALGPRPAEPRLVRSTLAYLSDRVAGRLRSGGLAGRTITVRVRFASRRVADPFGHPGGSRLLDLDPDRAGHPVWPPPPLPARRRRISLLAVSVSNLVDEPDEQLELPLGLVPDPHRAGTPASAARWQIDRSMDAIRARYGRQADRLRRGHVLRQRWGARRLQGAGRGHAVPDWTSRRPAVSRGAWRTDHLSQMSCRARPQGMMGPMVFYVIIFSLLAVLLVVAGLTTVVRRRNRLEAEERRHSSSADAARQKRKASRAQSQKDRRKRH